MFSFITHASIAATLYGMYDLFMFFLYLMD